VPADVPALRRTAEEFGTKFRYMRMIDIKLAYRKRTRSKAWMVMSPFCEDASLKLLTLTHNKAPDRAPPGHSLLSIFTEDCEYERQAAQTDEELVAWARGRVEALHPELKGHFLFHYLSREPRTWCFPDAGNFRRASRLWDRIGQEPRVHLGGDIWNFGSMEAAVSGGERAADRLALAS